MVENRFGDWGPSAHGQEADDKQSIHRAGRMYRIVLLDTGWKDIKRLFRSTLDLDLLEYS